MLMLNQNLKMPGINQTIHRIYLNLSTEIGILTPFGTFGNEVNNKILLIESVILGRVPENMVKWN